MRVPFSRIVGVVAILVVTLTLAACGGLLPKNSSMRSQQSLHQTTINRLKEIGSSPGAPMMIRIFKQTNEFEVWKQSNSGQFKLFSTYKICAYSGTYGPKIKEGDRQAPEGFYNITPALMNPNSNYYLAFNTGFPNKFDRSWGRTGANLMVHGDCSSSGCYSMTDEGIAEIYALARESFNGGNTVIQMQVFPFRMTPKNLAQFANDPNLAFWMDIKEGYDRFELTHRPPNWDVCEKKYVFDLTTGGTPLDATAACPAREGDTLLASLQTREQADDAQFKVEVAAITDRNAKQNAADQQAEAEKEAVKARSQAVGGFFSGVFGGGSAGANAPGQSGTAVVAPVPMPAPKGA